MGQGISDIFYPANPNRRNRAEQLREDILAYCNSYEEIKTARDELLKEIGPRLATLLTNEGYDSPEVLDAKVKSILTGDNLAQYLRVRSEHDKHSELERTIFSISSFISIGSGVFLGGLALLGIITGGTAFAILGGVAVALAAVAGILALFDIFEGERERRNLREVIYKLGPERVKARRAQMMMQAISDWTLYIKRYLDSAVVKENPDLVAEIWEGDFKADFAKSEQRQRGAWMNEDGDWMYQYSGRSFSAMNSTTIAFKGGSTTASSSKFTLADVSYTDGVTSRASATLTTFRQEDQPKVVLQRNRETPISMVVLEAAQELCVAEEQPTVVLQRNGEAPISMVVLEAAQDLCIAEDDEGEKWEFMPETVTEMGTGIELSVKSCLFSLRRLTTGDVLHDFGVVEFTPCD